MVIGLGEIRLRGDSAERASLRSPTNVEMRLIMEAANEPDWMAPWLRVYRRWFPEEERSVEELDDLSLRCLIARMAADGSWGHESMLPASLTQAARARVVAEILGLIDG
ncbi:hypothetical protein [Patulibacter defluvii]|uniref:hypothetical protein n=1 Tax=Patulibacter defluvii TaxID=3095358 RepID=UPI002A75D0EF|nr:hypothetical protein [Patulibacter sp. DM4]